MCAAIFEARGEDAERCAVAQGLGMQLVNIMRDVGEDARNGRIYIPADLLSRHGVTEEDIMTGRTGEGWRALMSEIGERAHEALEEGGGILPLSEPDARICPALLRDLYLRILERIERADYEVFQHDMDLSLAGKLLILSRAWWRYRIRRR